jgi:hypothetical protein
VASDADFTKGSRKLAIDAGIVPVLFKLIASAEEPAVYRAALLSSLLLGPAYAGDPRVVGPWASVRKCTSAQQRSAGGAIRGSWRAGQHRHHSDMGVDLRAWGIADSVQRLTMHTDLEMAALAVRLEKMFFVQHAPEVSSSPSPSIDAISLFASSSACGQEVEFPDAYVSTSGDPLLCSPTSLVDSSHFARVQLPPHPAKGECHICSIDLRSVRHLQPPYVALPTFCRN